MTTQKKPDSPDQYWVYPAGELQKLVGDPTDPRYQQLNNLTFVADMIYVSDVTTFCEGAQPDFTNPTADDFASGAWLDMYISIAMAGAYYGLCEEV